MSDLWNAVAAAVQQTTGRPFRPGRPHSIGGGCINSAYALEADGQPLFVKVNTASRLAMFEAELAGLCELAATQTVRVPMPLCTGVAGDRAFLVMEHLNLTTSERNAAARLGEQLAALHRVLGEHFGWYRDNTIGSTPQINTAAADWIEFWSKRRLGYQLDLAAANGAGTRLVDRGRELQAALPHVFENYSPAPSLLHGDLWGGNWSACATGEPVLFDPAVYYGDRETDLAMTELFGGFPPDFYAAYAYGWALDAGYAVRKHLYNLYHILNHFNLFGAGYRAQAESLIERVLAEIR